MSLSHACPRSLPTSSKARAEGAAGERDIDGDEMAHPLQVRVVSNVCKRLLDVPRSNVFIER